MAALTSSPGRLVQLLPAWPTAVRRSLQSFRRDPARQRGPPFTDIVPILANTWLRLRRKRPVLPNPAALFPMEHQRSASTFGGNPAFKRAATLVRSSRASSFAVTVWAPLRSFIGRFWLRSLSQGLPEVSSKRSAHSWNLEFLQDVNVQVMLFLSFFFFSGADIGLIALCWMYYFPIVPLRVRKCVNEYKRAPGKAAIVLWCLFYFLQRKAATFFFRTVCRWYYVPLLPLLFV